MLNTTSCSGEPEDRCAGPAVRMARIMRFVSTTSRTLPVLPPLRSDRVHFDLNFVVGQIRPLRTAAVSLQERRVG